MIDRIGTGAGGARSLIESAMQRHAEAVARATQAVDSSAAQSAGAQDVATSPFQNALVDGIKSVDAQVKVADQLAEGLVSGRIKDFHEVAAALKQSELSLKFSLEVRNKFVDAYREIMRMSV
jgi:flagellar hook-basal body complex protein FliE